MLEIFIKHVEPLFKVYLKNYKTISLLNDINVPILLLLEMIIKMVFWKVFS